MTDQPIAPGQTLAGKYRIDRVLGAGAMGLVLAATHLVLGSRVAIKVMLGGGKRAPEHEERFLREARVASMLRSEHAAKVLDVGTTEQGATYIVMEYLDGCDLGALLQARGALPVEEAVSYMLQACEAIAEAHGLGIVHRDIKPANLFLTTGVSGTPCVKVVDFGIAKQLDDAPALTQAGAALGSPLYMSPEQMRGSRDVDARSDIWALGVTLYELLAGVTPFHADTLLAVVTMINLDPPTPLMEYRPDVPASLAAVIFQCLEKNRERRWPSVSAFATALAPHASASSASYAERVARVQKADAAPARSTDLLPPEPTHVGASPTIVVPTPSPAAVPVPAWAIVVAALAMGLVLASSAFFSLRAHVSSPDATVMPTSRPVVSGPPTASVAASTAQVTDTAVAPSSVANVAPPSSAPVPVTAISAPQTPRVKPPGAAKATATVTQPTETGSRR